MERNKNNVTHIECEVLTMADVECRICGRDVSYRPGTDVPTLCYSCRHNAYPAAPGDGLERAGDGWRDVSRRKE